MTCADLTFKTREPTQFGRFAALAAAAFLGAATAAAVWTAHPAHLKGGARAMESAYVIAKIGVLPPERQRSDIPYGR